MKNYTPAELDTFAKGVTFTLSLIALGSFIFAFAHTAYRLISLTFFLIFTFTLFVGYLFKPLRYEVDANSLIIHRRFNRDYKIENIQKVLKTHANGIRTGGIGGVFGYYGWFNGCQHWFITNRKEAILIESENCQYLISPKNPEEFIRNFESAKSNHVRRNHQPCR